MVLSAVLCQCLPLLLSAFFSHVYRFHAFSHYRFLALEVRVNFHLVECEKYFLHFSLHLYIEGVKFCGCL